MARKIDQPDTVLVLSNEEFTAVNALLYALQGEEIARVNTAGHWGLGANQVAVIQNLWANLHGLEPVPTWDEEAGPQS